MIDLKISAIVGIAGSAIGAMVQAATGHTDPSGVLAAIGFGGFAGFATTFILIGSYKGRVDRHEEELKTKVGAKELEALTERVDEMHGTLNTIVKPIIEGHFRGQKP